MEFGSMTPEEFRKLQIKIDILQRFLTKTFGSSFLDFCKEETNKLSLTNGKSPGPNKSQLNGTGGTSITSLRNGKIEASQSNGVKNNNVAAKSPSSTTVTAIPRRPPPLLHRPGGGSTGTVKAGQNQVPTLTISSVTSMAGSSRNGNNAANNNSATIANKTVVKRESPKVDNNVEYYEEGNNEEDVVQFLQPETVFSDDDQQQHHKLVHTRNGVKREHSVAFGYEVDDADSMGGNTDNMQLPEGTECIAVETDEDMQGQHESYSYQDDGLYENGDINGEEYYDEESYSYDGMVVDEGLDVSENGTGGNYTSEELHTDGNVVFGNVITANDTGIQYFQCSFCPSAKIFKHKQSLKEHYLLNHSPTPPAFQCQCGRRFLKQSQLKRHEVVHTAERPFVCPICLKDFTRKDNMTVHMIRNHAEKKHPCPYCPDKIYATTAEVNRHLRMYHSQWQQ